MDLQDWRIEYALILKTDIDEIRKKLLNTVKQLATSGAMRLILCNHIAR